MSPPQSPEHFAFLLVSGFSNLCLANAIEPLRAANESGGATLYQRTLATLEGAAATSSSGIVIQPDCALADVGECDALFVLASYDYARASTPLMRRGLSMAARRARALGGLDTGSWLLADAGLLSGRRATIHGQELESFEERFLDVAVSPERMVIDGARITAGGATTALDLMLRLIRERHGEALAFEVMATFIYDTERAADEPQRGARDARFLARAPEVAEAMRLMEATAEEPLSIVEIAKRCGLSPRTLERRFRAHLGMSPEQCRLSIRLRKARTLARETAAPVSEIAARTGFSSSATLARAFRAAFGGSIRELRRGRM